MAGTGTFVSKSNPRRLTRCQGDPPDFVVTYFLLIDVSLGHAQSGLLLFI